MKQASVVDVIFIMGLTFRHQITARTMIQMEHVIHLLAFLWHPLYRFLGLSLEWAVPVTFDAMSLTATIKTRAIVWADGEFRH